MPTIKTSAEPNTDLHYLDRGTGTPVVLIHGWPLSMRMWEAQINALVDAGYRCIAYDRRGFGMSGKPTGGYDYDTFASDLNDLMIALDVKGAALAGFSMGGGEVARYIGKYGTSRVSKALLLGSVAPGLGQSDDNPKGAPPAMIDGMAAQIKEDRVGFLQDFFPKFFEWKPGSGTPKDDVVAAMKVIAWSASPQGTQDCVTAFGKTDFTADMKKFNNIPVLIVHGDADEIVPMDATAKRAHKMLPHSRFEVIKGAPHGFAATHAKELNKLMLDFLGS